MGTPYSELSSRGRAIRIIEINAWGAVLGLLIGCAVVFALRWQHPQHLVSLAIGSAASVGAIAGWITTTARWIRGSTALGADLSLSNDNAVAIETVDEPVKQDRVNAPIDVADLPRWIDTTNRLLASELHDVETSAKPRVSIIRVGPLGIELLLEEEQLSPPESFHVADGGRVWRLDPSLELSEIALRTESSIHPYLPVLIGIGDDPAAVFFVGAGPGEVIGIAGDDIADTLSRVVADLVTSPWSEATLYRLGHAKFLGAEFIPTLELDNMGDAEGLEGSADAVKLVVILTEDRGLAELARGKLGNAILIGPVVDADRVLYRSDDLITIEPAGLTVSLEPATAAFEHAAELLPTLASQQVAVETSGESESTSNGGVMPQEGKCEVRILREHPDLVGDIFQAPTANGLQFIAYLATHGGRASTSKLRDALGAYRLDTSLANKTVWAAASSARRALGPERVPNASGNQQYELSADVTCDWIRFSQAFKLARSLIAAGDTDRAISLLTGMLELVEGLPGPNERRFAWLDLEGLVHEIARYVREASRLLASIAVQSDVPQLADWAIERGKLILPDDGELSDEFLATAGTSNTSSRNTGKRSSVEDDDGELDNTTIELVTSLTDQRHADA